MVSRIVGSDVPLAIALSRRERNADSSLTSYKDFRRRINGQSFPEISIVRLPERAVAGSSHGRTSFPGSTSRRLPEPRALVFFQALRDASCAWWLRIPRAPTNPAGRLNSLLVLACGHDARFLLIGSAEMVTVLAVRKCRSQAGGNSGTSSRQGVEHQPLLLAYRRRCLCQ